MRRSMQVAIGAVLLVMLTVSGFGEAFKPAAVKEKPTAVGKKTEGLVAGRTMVGGYCNCSTPENPCFPEFPGEIILECSTTGSDGAGLAARAANQKQSRHKK